MKIKMKTTMAGPDGVVFPGKVTDVPEQKAVDLVEAGYAEYAGPVLHEMQDVEDTETASLEGAPETTAKLRATGKKRGRSV